MSDLNQHIFEREWLGKTLGIEFQELTPTRVVATMPITPIHHQPYGYLHGGASVALAESVASVGGALNCPPGKGVVGLEINANHVRVDVMDELASSGGFRNQCQPRTAAPIWYADGDRRAVAQRPNHAYLGGQDLRRDREAGVCLALHAGGGAAGDE